MKKASKNYNTQLIEAFSIRPIAFNPLLAKISGKATAGLFLSQMLYWWGKGREANWIYKTIKEFQEETSLTRSEQDTAIRAWGQLGVLRVIRLGIPPKRHFKIDLKRLQALIGEALKCRDLQEVANQSAERNRSIRKNRLYITESTFQRLPKDPSLQEAPVKSLDLTQVRKRLSDKLSINHLASNGGSA